MTEARRTCLGLEVAADEASAAQAAARWIGARIEAALAARGRAAVAFSGGRSPQRMLAALAALPLPWERVAALQVDERIVAAGSGARNLTMLQSALPRARWHAMPVEAALAAGDAAACAAAAAAGADEYARTLAAVAGTPAVLDLVHLGLGDDGHTASLFAGDAALEVRDRDVAVTAQQRGHRRLTLTLPVLSRARARCWLVTGADKRAMLAALRDGGARVPAARVARHDSVVFADAAAAAVSG